MPLSIREHPERGRRVRVTLVREALVALAVGFCPEIRAEIARVTSAPLLVDALNSYRRAAEKAASALGLAHHRELLSKNDGPLAIRYDMEDIVALAKLEPAMLTGWATAAAVLHVALERSAYAGGLRAVVGQLPPLASMAPWLVPSLVRWAHVRVYEILFGPFEQRGERVVMISDGVPPEWEEAAVMRTPGRPRSLFDKAIPSEDESTLAYKVKAWWGVRIERESLGVIARRWHAKMPDAQHRKKAAADNLVVKDCGCLAVVKKGIKEVDRLLTSPD